jgi:hypothetical protein
MCRSCVFGMLGQALLQQRNNTLGIISVVLRNTQEVSLPLTS